MNGFFLMFQILTSILLLRNSKMRIIASISWNGSGNDKVIHIKNLGWHMSVLCKHRLLSSSSLLLCYNSNICLISYRIRGLYPSFPKTVLSYACYLTVITTAIDLLL